MKLYLILILCLFLVGCSEVPSTPRMVPQDSAETGPAVNVPTPVPEPLAPIETLPVVTESVITEPVITEPSSMQIIEADEYGFYPNKITVNNSDNVQIYLVVRNTSVYNGGLDFRGAVINNTLSIKQGDGYIVEFVATKYSEIQSFSPGTNKFKAGMKVVVE